MRPQFGITCSRKSQIDQLEAIQRRALRIIYSYTNDMPYINALYCAAIPLLADRREQLSRKFFKSVHEPSSCLSGLLPNPRDPSITTRLRLANKFPRLPSRTKNIRHLFPMLCLTIRLHSHSAIYFSILLVFFLNFPHFCLFVYHVLCYLVLWPQDWVNTTTTTWSILFIFKHKWPRHYGLTITPYESATRKMHKQPFAAHPHAG